MIVKMIKHISPADAATRFDAGDSRWLDIRDPQSWQQSHIPGAVHIDNDSLQAFVDATAKDETLIVYCYHGNSSQSAAAWFGEQGFADVYTLDGGFEVWRQQFADKTTTP